MYKILIVDDEDMIRRGIVNAISWNELNISKVLEANNGEEAFKIFEDEKPDIILSDIRMPRLSGLELLSLVREVDETTIFILLSGYEEFEFAQRAIREGAFGYLLKSSSREELVHSLKEALQQLEKRNHKEEAEATLRQQFYNNLPVLREQLLNELLHGTFRDDKQTSRLAFSGIHFNFQKYYVSMAEIDHYYDKPKPYDAEDMLLYRFSIKNVIEEVFGHSIVFQSYDGRFLVLTEITQRCEVELDKIIENWDLIKQLTESYYHLTLSVAITDVFEGLTQVKEAYADAKRIISYKFNTGASSTILSKDVKHDFAEVHEISEEDTANLKTELHVGNEEGVREIINNIFDKVVYKKIEIHGFRLVCLTLVNLAKKIMTKLDREASNDLFSQVDLLSEMNKIDTSEYGRKWVLSYYQQVLSSINSKRMNKTMAIIQQATDYIENNYTNEITLNDVANYVHLSASYFSGLFSQETGMSFLAYLTFLRINKAKELLSYGELNVSEVGSQVGYPNPYYFSRIFKKHTGSSPMEYKAKI